MVYDAPHVTEVGNVHQLTLGREALGPRQDNSVRQGYAGRPIVPQDPTPPVGSR